MKDTNRFDLELEKKSSVIQYTVVNDIFRYEKKLKNINSNNYGKKRAMLDEDDWHQTVD